MHPLAVLFAAVVPVAAALASMPAVALGQGGSDTVRGDDVFFLDNVSQDAAPQGPTDETITIHTIATGQDREIFRPKLGKIFDFRVAPTSAMIAVTEQVRKFDVDPQLATTVINGHPTFERTVLYIVDRDGNQIDQVEGGVRSFAWSPDGEQLAYVTGDYKNTEGVYGNTKAWIWGRDKSRRQISGDIHDKVSWAAFDDNIYLWERTATGAYGAVLRYNVSANRLERTSHKGIFFSPTGTYYFHPGGGYRENVYLRATDTVIRSQVISELAAWRPIAWARDSDFLLMEAMKGPNDPVEQAVFDPVNDSAIDLRLGQSFMWGQDSTEIVVKNGDRYEKRRIR